MLQPVKRSRLRVLAGTVYYKSRRYMKWYLSSTRWAKTFQQKDLDHLIFRHQTPLVRKLKDVDMWMQYNKIENLKIASSKLNGLLVYPGETFSFWRMVGKTTRRKGYKKGMVLSYGRVFAEVGGGLCQLTNLLYWMTLHTPLQVTERYRHSYDVFPDADRKLPFGSGATCAYNYIDLQVYNPTDQAFQLLVYLTEENLVGEWRAEHEPECSYEVYQKDHWITQEFWGGYVRHNLIYRKVFGADHELLRDEYVTENHAIMMYPPFLEEGSNSRSSRVGKQATADGGNSVSGGDIPLT